MIFSRLQEEFIRNTADIPITQKRGMKTLLMHQVATCQAPLFPDRESFSSILYFSLAGEESSNLRIIIYANNEAEMF